jgi:hypothetical protein
VKVGSIIRYTSAISQNSLSIALRDGEVIGIGTDLTITEIFNRVVAVSSDRTSVSISSITSVPWSF